MQFSHEYCNKGYLFNLLNKWTGKFTFNLVLEKLLSIVHIGTKVHQTDD